MNKLKKKSHNDFRVDDRFDTEVTVICRPYTSAGNIRSIKGVMRNFSRQGSYVEMDRKFKSGTILIIRTIGSLPSTLSPHTSEKPRSICLVEIKWLQDLKDANESRYGMGLRYLD